MVLFTASRRNTFVGGTCAPLSALLVSSFVWSEDDCRREIFVIGSHLTMAQLSHILIVTLHCVRKIKTKPVKFSIILFRTDKVL